MTREMLTTDALKQLYYTLIFPHLFYCHTVWGGVSHNKMNSITVAQKRVIRTISFKRKFHHTSPCFKKLSILKLIDVTKYCFALFVYKSLNNHAPNNFFQYSTNGRYDLRNNNLLRIPLVMSTQSQTSIIYRGAKIWNDTPSNIKDKNSIYSFKRSLKMSLMLNY